MPRKKSAPAKKEPEKLVDMVLTEEQLNLVGRCLDTYSRLLAGQWSELTQVVRTGYFPSKGVINWDNLPAVDRIVENAKTLIFTELPSPGAGMGLGNPELSEEAVRAYEVRKWIDNYFARYLPEDDWSVMRDPPITRSGQRKVDIERLEEGVTGPVDEGIAKLKRIVTSLALLLGQAGIAVKICTKCGLAVREDKLHGHKCGNYQAELKAAVAEARDKIARGRKRPDGQNRVPSGGNRPGGRKGKPDDVPVFQGRQIL